MKLIGALYEVCACTTDGLCGNSLMFLPLNGGGIEDVANIGNAPLKRPIEATFDGNRLVAYELSPVAAMLDAGHKDIALIRYGTSGLEDEEITKVKREAKRLEHYINRVNETHNYPWRFVRVTPYYLRTDDVSPGPAAMPNNLRVFGDRLRAQHPDKFDEHTYFHTWGGAVSGSALGLAGVNSPYCWSGLAGNTSVIRHEQFHTFGCYHTSTPSAEYRSDTYCTMGNGGNSGVCMPQLARLGLYEPEHIVEAGHNQRYFLVPAEVNSADVRQGEIKGLWVQMPSTSTNWVLLSIRKGASQSILGYGDETIHIDETRRTFGYNPIARGTIRKGQSRTINGTKIINHGAHEGVVEVEVGTAEPEPFPQPAPPGKGDPFEGRHSGIWNNPAYAHQGVFLIVGRREIRGHWYTHNAKGIANAGLMDISANLWFVMRGQAGSNNVFSFDVHQTVEGEDRVVGRGTMKLNDGEILMRSWTEAFGRESMRLTQLTAAPDGPVEVRASAPDDGFTLGKFGNTYIAIHFQSGYRHETPWAIHIGEDPEQLRGFQAIAAYKQHYSELKDVAAADFEEVRRLPLQFAGNQ